MADLNNTTNFCPRSLLDTDLYKFTMQQAILQHFPRTNVTYRFNNWTREMLFSLECFELVKQSVSRLSELRLTTKEAKWLKANCPYFTEEYIEYLSSYRFRPDEHVKLELHVAGGPTSNIKAGCITIEITGLWVETIPYEVPLMAILSEAYFLTVEKNWTYVGQEELAYRKAKHLIQASVTFSDFGTRRRRSYHGQDIVIQGLIRGQKELSGKGVQGRLASTSNPHFAMKYDLPVIGVIAHEWIMGIAAIYGYENANGLAMDLWEATYPTEKSSGLHIALTDTFSTDVFNVSFKANIARAGRWEGLRSDSGDPFEFISKARAAYEQMGIAYREKVLVFSDGLDVELAAKIQWAVCQAGFTGLFGIGTFFTNDYKRMDGKERSKPLVMVIKIASVEGKSCVKISDDPTKNTGDSEIMTQIKQKFGIAT